ncbi:MAG: hypothetical protein M0Z46_17090 [Actinomycetota bacterium]|nr:hypothetical protein [Actinomycetota bacterium]
MSQRGGERLGEAGGLVTRVDAPVHPGRPAPGERLATELADLDAQHRREAGAAGEARADLAREIERLESERAGLREQARALNREADALGGRVTELNHRLDALPDEARFRAQRAADRFSLMGRVLHADTHAVREMLDAYALHVSERRAWESKVRSTPEMTEDVELLEYAQSSPDAIEKLDGVVRAIIEQRLAEAKDKVADLPEPTRPEAAAPIYECVAPGVDAGMVAVVAIPCGPAALTEHHPEADLVAEVLAAVSKALLEQTDADAPVVRARNDRDDPLYDVLLVGARCSEVDADIFGAQLLELFEECRGLGLTLVPINDKELALSLAKLLHEELGAR